MQTERRWIAGKRFHQTSRAINQQIIDCHECIIFLYVLQHVLSWTARSITPYCGSCRL